MSTSAPTTNPPCVIFAWRWSKFLNSESRRNSDGDIFIIFVLFTFSMENSFRLFFLLSFPFAMLTRQFFQWSENDSGEKFQSKSDFVIDLLFGVWWLKLIKMPDDMNLASPKISLDFRVLSLQIITVKTSEMPSLFQRLSREGGTAGNEWWIE